MISVLTKERNSLPSEGGYQYIDNEDYILGYMDVHKPNIVGLDTETTGLEFLDNEMVMLQIGTLDHQFLIDTRYFNVDFLKPILESKEVIKVLHNAIFDYKFLRKEGIVLERVYDTMLMDKVINCGKSKPTITIKVPGKDKPDKVRFSSLRACSYRYLGEDIEKDTGKSFINHKGPFTEAQIIYGAKDVTVPLRLVEAMKPIIKKEKLSRTVSLENRAVLAFGDIEYNGIGIDKEAWLERAKVTKSELDRLHMDLDHFIESDPKYREFQADCAQMDLFDQDKPLSFVNVNWDSPKQALEILKKEHPKLQSVSSDTLSSLPEKSEIVRKYMAYKKIAKLYSSYGPSMLEHVKSDGRIHTSFQQILETGRVSSSMPNMQQIPADNSFRNCFVSGYEDWVFVSSDYSSQELCVIATISQDPVWLKALEQGKDLHSVCAALVYGNEWRKRQNRAVNSTLPTSRVISR